MRPNCWLKLPPKHCDIPTSSLTRMYIQTVCQYWRCISLFSSKTHATDLQLTCIEMLRNPLCAHALQELNRLLAHLIRSVPAMLEQKTSHCIPRFIILCKLQLASKLFEFWLTLQHMIGHHMCNKSYQKEIVSQKAPKEKSCYITVEISVKQHAWQGIMSNRAIPKHLNSASGHICNLIQLRRLGSDGV